MTRTRTRLSLSIISLVIAFLFLVPAPAGAVDTLQPGDYVETSVGSCTLSFVYDGLGSLAGKVYIGTAAHCVSNVGELVRDIDGATVGRVALIGNANITAQDYAFIEVLSGAPSARPWSAGRTIPPGTRPPPRPPPETRWRSPATASVSTSST